MLKDIHYKKYFENKRITKQGFGILGRGLGVVKFLLENGSSVLVTDMKPESFFVDQIAELKDWMKNHDISEDKVEFVFGEHRIDDFTKCDYVVQASGVPKDNLYLKAARDNNIKVYQESSLFLEIVRDFNNNLKKENREEDAIKIITITGTRGKTTTTHLIYTILRDYFEDNIKDRKVYLGGNVQGISTIELLNNIKKKDIVVMETDSWLAQGFGDIKFAPDIAVFTNLMRDHMNYYKDDMSEYFLDKAQTFLYQDEKSTLIADESLLENINKYLSVEYKQIFNNLKSKKIIINPADIEEDKKVFESSLKGEHNRINISLAVRTAVSIGIDIESIKRSIKNFKGVSGRLEFVKELDGVDYYNDTTATTGEATIAAIRSFKDISKKIILITGGTDKELQVEAYVDELIKNKKEDKIKNIIFLSNESTTGTKKAIGLMSKKDFNDYELASSLELAVDSAKAKANSGDVILFSPGFASFGMFLNEYDRGEKFLKLI